MTENNAETKYVYGLGLIGEEVSGNFKTYHFDYRGSTVAITNANGTVTDTFEYDTYGKLKDRTGTTKTPFLYNGRDGVITEDDTGLYYMRARYYSPMLRRFINADKVHGDISNALTLNRYAFCNGDPANGVDPLGLKGVDARGGVVGGIVGSSMASSRINETIKAPYGYAYVRCKNGYKMIPYKDVVSHGINDGDLWFNTKGEAAFYFAYLYNGKSISEDIEYAATIYSKKAYLYNNMYYSVLDLAKLHADGEIASMKQFYIDSHTANTKRTIYYVDYKHPDKSGERDNKGSLTTYVSHNYKSGRIEGSVHTHGKWFYDGGLDFSSKDEESLYKWHRKGYDSYSSFLANPRGELRMRPNSIGAEYDFGKQYEIEEYGYMIAYDVNAF